MAEAARRAADPLCETPRTADVRYRWQWDLEASPERLWPLVSDTNRFNRDGRGPRVRTRARRPNGGLRLEVEVAGRTMTYEETPFEWVRPERFGVERRYANGPLAELRALVTLSPNERGTTLVYELEARPRSLLSRPVVAYTLGSLARRRFERTFRRYDAIASGATAPGAAPRERPAFAPGGAERLARLEQELATSSPPALARLLCAHLRRADPLELARMRPYALADAHGSDRLAMLETFLQATADGLLESRWELICPHCRGAAARAPHLASVEDGQRCPSCDVEVFLELEQSLELVFAPAASVLPVEHADYCVGGPGVTRHVVVRQLLAAGERRDLQVALEPGSYRLRGRSLTGSLPLQAQPHGPATAEARADPTGWACTDGEPRRLEVGLSPTLALANDTPGPLLVDIERDSWGDQAATAADVTSRQRFRRLFGSEALRPGLALGIARLTLVFTDLRDSTRLYRDVGDAPAFGAVVDHFTVLEREIGARGGTVVKTIGDAVMAVFRHADAALEAVVAAQRALAAPAAGSTALRLKAGLHLGPCIAVTLNERLDYFGSAVNAAARIAPLSDGADVVISDDVRCDPDVNALLADGRFHVTALQATLRGFEGEPFRLWRVSGGG